MAWRGRDDFPPASRENYVSRMVGGFGASVFPNPTSFSRTNLGRGREKGFPVHLILIRPVLWNNEFCDGGWKWCDL